jgi:hypothetical protein
MSGKKVSASVAALCAALLAYCLLWVAAAAAAEKVDTASARAPGLSPRPSGRTEIVVEETRNNTSWRKSARTIRQHDPSGELIEEMEELWNGSGWNVAYRSLYTYDGFRQQTGYMKLSRDTATGQWNMAEGQRDIIDTMDSKGHRVVMEDAVWDTVRRGWSSEDSTVYDSKGKILREVSVETDTRTGDTVFITDITANTYVSDKEWIETCTSRSSSDTTASVEKSRYRKTGASGGMDKYAIDAWDEETKEWIAKVARAWRAVDKGVIILDSVAELIDGTLVPTYVHRRTWDARGNLEMERYWHKDYDDELGKWIGGRLYTTVRSYTPGSGVFAMADSSFEWDFAASSWKLYAYENVRHSAREGGCDETGAKDPVTNTWDKERSCDSLAPWAQVLSYEEYWDSESSSWTPANRFLSTLSADSAVIIEEVFDYDTERWSNQNRVCARIGSDKKAVSETWWDWMKNVPGGQWSLSKRLSYVRE